MKKNIIIPVVLLTSLFLWFSVSGSESQLYNLGPIKIELINSFASRKKIVRFKVYNTSGIPVRYFSINCKILKEGYLIDERTCNGFGIDANSWKEVQAKFLWLPSDYDIDFEINKIRTERLDLVQREKPSKKIERPELLEMDNVFEPAESDPMDLIDNEFEVGEKYQLYDEGEWFPNN